MKKLIAVILLTLINFYANANKIEQTICFSKSKCNTPYAYGVLGDNIKLCGGKCQGKTLTEMNKKGWKLIQIVNGLQSSFGMVFIREK